MPSAGAMIVLFLFVCMLITASSAFGLVYSMSGSPSPSPDTSGPSPSPGTGGPSPAPSPGPAPAPAPTDPRSSVWSASGQLLESGPLEIGIVTASVPLTHQPTLPSTATYTISMDLNIAAIGTSNTYRCILANKDGSDWSGSKPAPNTRRPLIGIPPRSAQIFINHSDANDNGQGDGLWLNGTQRTGPDFTPGQWANYTWVLDSTAKTGKFYINGVLKGNFTATNPFAWPSPSTTWVWNNVTSGYEHSSSVKVANAYFWQSALTDTQIAKLAVPSSPTPGVSTTSYYMPDPAPYGADD